MKEIKKVVFLSQPLEEDESLTHEETVELYKKIFKNAIYCLNYIQGEFLHIKMNFRKWKYLQVKYLFRYLNIWEYILIRLQQFILLLCGILKMLEK